MSDDQSLSLDTIQDLMPCEDTTREDAASACHGIAACEEAIGAFAHATYMLHSLLSVLSAPSGTAVSQSTASLRGPSFRAMWLPLVWWRSTYSYIVVAATLSIVVAPSDCCFLCVDVQVKPATLEGTVA